MSFVPKLVYFHSYKLLLPTLFTINRPYLHFNQTNKCSLSIDVVLVDPGPLHRHIVYEDRYNVQATRPPKGINPRTTCHEHLWPFYWAITSHQFDTQRQNTRERSQSVIGGGALVHFRALELQRSDPAKTDIHISDNFSINSSCSDMITKDSVSWPSNRPPNRNLPTSLRHFNQL